MSENRADACSGRASEERSAFTSETFNIQYYFLAGRSRRGAHTSSRADRRLALPASFRLRVKRTEETGGGEAQIKNCTRGTEQHNRGNKRKSTISHLWGSS